MFINQYLFAQTFLEATLTISASSTPLIQDVIPWIDVMTKHVEDTCDNVNKLPIVRTAAHKGFKILQKYYWKTDDTPFYRVAMCTYYSSCTSHCSSIELLIYSAPSMLQAKVLCACLLAPRVGRGISAPPSR